MKFVCKILNIFLVVILFCMFTLVQFGVFNLIAMPAGDDAIIGFAQKDIDGDGVSDNISYLDTYRFIGDDVKNSAINEPRYLVRGWFKWSWWQSGMRWADVAIEAINGTVVPIFAPMYEVSELQYYYTSDTPVVSTIGNGTFKVYGLVVLASDEYKKIYPEDSLTDYNFINTFYDTHGTYFAYYETIEPVSTEKTVAASGKLLKIKDGKAEVINTWFYVNEKENFKSSEWIKENRSFVNTLYRINKYNKTNKDGINVYRDWKYKFYDVDKNMRVKSSVVSLYFQFFLSIILALWFIKQNPIVCDRNPDGTISMSGGIKFGRRKRKKKTDEEKDE